MGFKIFVAVCVLVFSLNICRGKDISGNVMQRLAALEHKVEKQAVQLQAKDYTIKHLSAKVDDLQSRIDNLESSNQCCTPSEEIAKQNTSMQSTMSIKNEYSDIETASPAKNSIKHQNVYLNKKDRLSKREAQLRRIRQSNLIAFHGVSDKNVISSIGLNQNIVFETVLLNKGNAYHQQHGVFIAPTTGLYIFSASILSSKDDRIFDANIVRNGDPLVRIYTYGTAQANDQGSATVITQLNAGDEVWVRHECCGCDSMVGLRYSTFTGDLLIAS